GKLLWQKTLPGPAQAEWLSSSPILFEDTLFQFIDVSDEFWLRALDKKSGEVKWEARRKQGNRTHNSSPLLVVAKGRPQIVVGAEGAVVARDAKTGKEIWTCKWRGNRYASLVAGTGLVIAAGEGGEGLAIDPTGEGEVGKTHVKWRHTTNPKGFGSPIIV